MPAGRPRAFATVEALQEGIDDYIQKATEEKRPLNISSLAAHLEVNRHTIFDYQKGIYGKEYSHPIKKVVQICEAQTVEGLISGKKSAAGCIFVLTNNHGHQNKHYRESSGESTKIVKLDPESAKAIASGIRATITED